MIDTVTSLREREVVGSNPTGCHSSGDLSSVVERLRSVSPCSLHPAAKDFAAAFDTVTSTCNRVVGGSNPSIGRKTDVAQLVEHFRTVSPCSPQSRFRRGVSSRVHLAKLTSRGRFVPDTKLNPKDAKRLGTHNYMVNIAAHRNGIGYREWLHIDGFSEFVIDYIRQYEASL